MVTSHRWLLLLVTAVVWHGLLSTASEMCPRITIENGRVKLRSRNRVAKFRCRRNFLMIEGDRLVTCSLGTWRGTIPKCVGSGCGNVLPIANGRSLLLFGDAMAQFECNPGYELLGSSALSCNGRRWNTTAPTCEAPKHTLYDCNFEQLGMCTWASESTGDLRWQLSLGPSIVQGMGKRPRFDHTYGNVSGHYVYMDSTVNAGWNDVARLYSPVLKPFVISPSCVTLWLYRSVRSTGEVNIYVKPESEDLDIQAPEVQITDEAWNGWHLVYISLQDIDEPFQVVLEAVWGDGYMSDIAVDDFLVTFGPRCFELETEYARQSLDDFTNATDFNNPVIVPITTRSPMAIITVGPPPTSTTLEQRTLSTTTTTAVTTAAKPGGSSTPRSNAVTPAPPDVLSPAKTSSQAARVTTASIVRAPSTPLTTKSPNSRKPTRPIDRVSITRPTVVTERPAQIITTVSLDLPVSDEVKSPEKERKFSLFLSVLLVSLSIVFVVAFAIFLYKKCDSVRQLKLSEDSDVKYLQQGDDESNGCGDSDSMMYQPRSRSGRSGNSSPSTSTASSMRSDNADGSNLVRKPIRPPPPIPRSAVAGAGVSVCRGITHETDVRGSRYSPLTSSLMSWAEASQLTDVPLAPEPRAVGLCYDSPAPSTCPAFPPHSDVQQPPPVPPRSYGGGTSI